MRAALLLGLLLIAFAPEALAGPAFYVDLSGGDFRLSNPASFFNNSVSNSTQNAFGAGLGLWTTFTNGEPPLEFQLGLQDRYITGSDSGGHSFVLNTPFAVARLQASLIYLG